MPRKFLRRWVPSHKTHRAHHYPKLLRPLLDEPNLFHINRHSASVAFFVGIFCAFLPIPGQTLVAILMALALRCNLPISAALIWITNPLTIPPIFYLTFELGRWMLDSPPMNFHIQFSLEWLDSQGRAFIAPLLAGSLSCGLLFGALGYLAIRNLWRWHVVRNWEARKRRLERNRQQDHS